MTKRDRRRRAVVSEEFEGVELGDARRNNRAKKIADRLAAQPPASLPAAMMDRAMLEALYRHLSNEGVSFEALLEPHVRRSVARVKAAEVAYAVHDTTECSFGGASRRSGLGTIHRQDQDFLAPATVSPGLRSDQSSGIRRGVVLRKPQSQQFLKAKNADN